MSGHSNLPPEQMTARHMSGHADTIRTIIERDVPTALGFRPTWTREQLAALDALLAEMKQADEHHVRCTAELAAQVSDALAENQRLREALTFYAEHGFDRGQIAREALAGDAE